MPVDDESFIQYMCALRITLNEVGIVVSTRERSEFRDKLVGLGVTEMSAQSVTKPGGYAETNLSTPQFQLEDRRTVSDFSEMLVNRGFTPVYKDIVQKTRNIGYRVV
jgi:2-iminoacetate synthase